MRPVSDFRKAKLLNDIVATPPWMKRLVIRAGEMVIVEPADNLPSTAQIKVWVHPCTVDQDERWGVYSEGPYGVGAYADDYEYVD